MWQRKGDSFPAGLVLTHFQSLNALATADAVLSVVPCQLLITKIAKNRMSTLLEGVCREASYEVHFRGALLDERFLRK
jgi:hypothetical protein